MCGIAGIAGYGTRDRERLLGEMSKSVAHRGPDDVGEWSDDWVALAHRRLSIIDLSDGGHQPMVSTCERYVISYNGEIYNYLELRRDLESKGVEFRSESDTEVILASYIRYGPECLKQFNGMWAFVIWDRHSKSLFASRDRFGKKPFYYTILGEQFFFASEAKALIKSGLIQARVNRSAVADFCAERVSDHRCSTFFEGVFQLAPGSWAVWAEGRLETGVFWSLPSDSQEEASLKTVEEIQHLILSAIALRLRSDAPVGVLLSGGLDSSAVACIASDLHRGGIDAFSTVYMPPVEEAAGIKHVINSRAAIRLQIDQPGISCLTDEIAACLWHQEEPFADGTMLAHFRLMRLAKERGIKVLLSGQGADEVFAGYPSYLPIHLAGLLARGRIGEALSLWSRFLTNGHLVPLRGVLGYALPEVIGSRIRAVSSRRSINWLRDEFAEVSPDVSSGFVKAAHANDPLNGALRESLGRRTLPGFLHYEDRNSMAFGVETRLPYLDFRLVDYVLPLAGTMKLRDGETKSLLRAAVESTVPSFIVRRQAKQAYPAPLQHWLRAQRAIVETQWFERISSCPLISFPRWRMHYERFVSGSDEELPAVWRGLGLALWHDMFFSRSV